MSQALLELGIDLADRRPHRLDRADAEWADVVVTMAAATPARTSRGSGTSTGTSRIRRGSRSTTSAVRDQIGVRIDALVAELGRASPVGQVDKE
jgi:protein-tyrosine-phosphatase